MAALILAHLSTLLQLQARAVVAGAAYMALAAPAPVLPQRTASAQHLGAMAVVVLVVVLLLVLDADPSDRIFCVLLRAAGAV